MTSAVRRRALAVAVLLLVLFGLSVWMGTLEPAPSLGDYPGSEELANDYDRYLNEPVTVGGDVVSTSPVVIAAEYGAGETIYLTITDLAIQPEPGDKLRVYGYVRADHTVEAIHAFTVPKTGLWYTWSVSFLVGLWVLGRIVRHWRLHEWALERRSSPRSQGAIILKLGGDDADA